MTKINKSVLSSITVLQHKQKTSNINNSTKTIKSDLKTWPTLLPILQYPVSTRKKHFTVKNKYLKKTKYISHVYEFLLDAVAVFFSDVIKS